MSIKQVAKKKNTPTFLQRYKKWLYTGSVAAVVIIVLFLTNNKSLTGKSSDDGSIPSNVGSPDGTVSMQAPNFNLPATDRKNIKLSDYKGKVLILDFWATWCPPCIRGIPDLIELKKKYGPEGFEIIGISVDQDTKADVIPFVTQRGINYPVVYADAGVTALYGGIEAIPTSFVIDKEGKIIASYQGLTSKSVYEDHIKKLLAM